MQFAAKLKDLQLDMETNKVICTFEIENLAVNRLDLQKYKECDLCSVEVSKWTDKRSLNANAYCWVLCSKIAEKIRSSKDEVYEDALQRYGYLDEDIAITVKSEVDTRMIDGHWKFIQKSSDGKWSAYIRIRGTSEYNTKEMAHFLDLLVDDAKQAGVKTLSSAEINAMKERWGI